MGTNRANEVVRRKREWHYELTPEAKSAGFKGWHSRGYLPHFDAPGIRQFITYRLADSVPAEMREEWEGAKRMEDDREKFRRMEVMLDRGGGACHLRNARVAELIEENLWFHDGKSYRLLAWVVMPNHVHILAEMWKPLGEVVKNWKSYTGSKANAIRCSGEIYVTTEPIFTCIVQQAHERGTFLRSRISTDKDHQSCV